MRHAEHETEQPPEADEPHPFERRGLGVAPFRFVTLRREAGGCAFCGRSIAWVCVIADADGRQAVVGTDCVRRTCRGSRLADEVERELKWHKKQAAEERHRARWEACCAALRADPSLLTDEPHPQPWRRGETLRDEAIRLLRGTRAMCTEAFGIVETALTGSVAVGAKPRAGEPVASHRSGRRGAGAAPSS